MKYVKYDLKWTGGLGEQPYQLIADNGAEFDGGVFLKDGVYFGYVLGEDDVCKKAIEACLKDYKMEEITQEQSITLYENAFGKNKEVVNDDKTYILGDVYLKEDGKLAQYMSLKI